MSPNRPEAAPLLRTNSLPSYDACDDASVPPTPVEGAPQNKISRGDLTWVLAGLWSAVFLGALDGKPAPTQSLFI